jgi:glycosyltransferase involved in cell wall biosynthesis
MTGGIPGLVSIVMPVHNLGKYLAEAIDSVRAQTYPNWELLIIDDGSTDDSAVTAREYARRDPSRIRYLTHDDGRWHGASASRNVGLAHARGEFLGFLDADDVWLPTKLAEQVALFREHPDVEVLYGRTLYWYSWTGRPEDRRDRAPRLRMPAGRVIPAPRLLTACLLGRAAVPCPSSILIRRSAVEAAGEFEERFQRIYTDQVFYSKLLLKASALPVNTCWDKYRQHPESSSAGAQRANEGRARRAAYLEWLTSYIEEHSPVHPAVARAVRRELWRTRHPLADRLLDRLEYLRRRLHDTADSLLSKQNAG